MATMLSLPPANFVAPAGATETLILSDLHLGLPGSRPGDVLALLEGWRFERLILLGDVFHDFRFEHLSADTWRLLRHIRGLGQERRAEIVWLKGNHDRHLATIVATLTGIRMRESFRWSCDGKQFLAVHGDRFDRFIATNRRMSQKVSSLYAFCQRRLSRDGDWPKVFDRLHGKLTNLGEEVAQRAARFAGLRAADVIVCGHTHAPLHRRFPSGASALGAVDYYNAGAWVDSPSSFITVDAGEGVHIRHCP